MKKRALLGVTLLTFTTLAGCTNLSEQKSGEKQTEVAEAKATESEKSVKMLFYDWRWHGESVYNGLSLFQSQSLRQACSPNSF